MGLETTSDSVSTRESPFDIDAIQFLVLEFPGRFLEDSIGNHHFGNDSTPTDPSHETLFDPGTYIVSILWIAQNASAEKERRLQSIFY